MFKYSF